MKALAKGTNEEVVLKLIKNLLNSTQGSQFETYLDDTGIRDIADVIEAEGDFGDSSTGAIMDPSQKDLDDPRFMEEEKGK